MDVDGVLSEHGEPIPDNIIFLLRQLSKKIKIVLASGKSVSYLEGLARGMGVQIESIIGENGGCIFFPKENKEINFLQFNPKFKGELEKMRKEVEIRLEGRFWSRENKTVITLLPTPSWNVEYIEDVCRRVIDEKALNLNLALYSFAVQILPRGLNKGWAVSKLSEALNCPLNEFIAVGNDEVDVPMLKIVGLPISVGNNKVIKEVSKLNFESGDMVLKYVSKIV